MAYSERTTPVEVRTSVPTILASSRRDLYHCRLAALKSPNPCTHLEIFKIVRKLLSPNIALGARLRKSESCKHDAWAALRAVDAKLAKESRDPEKLIELRVRQASSDMSVQKLTTESGTVKAKLNQVTAETFGLSTKLGAVASESDKSIEEQAGVREV